MDRWNISLARQQHHDHQCVDMWLVLYLIRCLQVNVAFLGHYTDMWTCINTLGPILLIPGLNRDSKNTTNSGS